MRFSETSSGVLPLTCFPLDRLGQLRQIAFIHIVDVLNTLNGRPLFALGNEE